MAKLKGSTLVEVIVAMVIVVFCTSLATLIYINILTSQRTGEKLRAFYVLKSIAHQSQMKSDYLDSEIIEEGFTIKKRCKTYLKSRDLIELRLIAHNDSGTEVYSLKKIVVNR